MTYNLRCLGKLESIITTLTIALIRLSLVFVRTLELAVSITSISAYQFVKIDQQKWPWKRSRGYSNKTKRLIWLKTMYLAAGSHLNTRSNRVVLNSRMARMGCKINSRKDVQMKWQVLIRNSKTLICVICVTLLWRIVKYLENWWSIMLDRSEKKKEKKINCFKKLVDPSKNYNFLREILNLLLQ